MNETAPSSEDIQAYKQTNSVFDDYTRFGENFDKRLQGKRQFIENDEYTAQHTYEKLENFHDQSQIVTKKGNIVKAVMELRAAQRPDAPDNAELELYAQYHEYRLKKIMLVESARDLRSKTISGLSRDTARETFMRLNAEIYGELDEPLFLGMLASEIDNLATFEPHDHNARAIVTRLEAMLNPDLLHNQREAELLSSTEIERLHEFVIDRYASILSAVPDTDDSVRYDAEACVRIMDDALRAGGLYELGWRAEIDDSKTNPSTNASSRRIKLPRQTLRTASELRRLIVHEQEVHARRGENGTASGQEILRTGTAAYADVEEGLGVLLECAVAGDLNNPSFMRARDRYLVAGLALGVDMPESSGRDARTVYEIMWRLLSVRGADSGEVSDAAEADAKERAFVLVENAYRSTPYWMRGTIYTKLKIYYEGLSKNAAYLRAHIDNLDEALDTALMGKYDHTNDAERALIESLSTQQA